MPCFRPNLEVEMSFLALTAGPFSQRQQTPPPRPGNADPPHPPTPPPSPVVSEQDEFTLKSKRTASGFFQQDKKVVGNANESFSQKLFTCTSNRGLIYGYLH